jgi:folate-dependent phosphoribosylglycinamide formyltransferase PurN
MDFDQYDFDKIITEKIIPLIKQDKDQISNSRVDHYEFRLYPSSGY